MFPYTPTDDEAEIAAFMAGVGATERTTRYGVGDDSGVLRQAIFSVPTFPDNPYAEWEYDEFSRRYTTYAEWTRAVGLHIKSSLIEDQGLRQDHHMFDLAERVARTLVELGYPRHITAATLILYGHRQGQRQWQPDHDVLDMLVRCADIHLLFRLTPAQQLDCAARDMPLAALVDLLDADVPYTLIKETYPITAQTAS